jgi:hypothetical protein
VQTSERERHGTVLADEEILRLARWAMATEEDAIATAPVCKLTAADIGASWPVRSWSPASPGQPGGVPLVPTPRRGEPGDRVVWASRY